MSEQAIFYYHPQGALIFPTQFQAAPDGRAAFGGYAIFPIQLLAAFGWKGTQADFARSLPHLEQQPRVAVAKTMDEAHRVAAGAAGLLRRN